MTAQKGKDLLLKVDSNGAGSFITVAGLRARTLALLIAAEDRLSRLKSMSGLIDSTVKEFAKSIEERAGKVEEILEKEEEKNQG